jgi:chorismate synthase
MPLRYLTAGESHGPAILVILEGMPAGLSVDIPAINHQLERRQRGYGAGPRMKLEQDRVEILAGVLEGQTTGAPVAMIINNLNHARWRGRAIDPFTIPRPGHVDLAAAAKYGYSDLRPGLERASARETVARVAAGALCKQLLSHFGILIGGYVTSIGSVHADLEQLTFEQRINQAEASTVRCPEPQYSERMEAEIRQAIENRDTLGGIIEVVALGLPVGLGSHVHWDRKLEAQLGAAILSVQAIKGIEFGAGFKGSSLPGTQAHDPIILEGEQLFRPATSSGGIEGGISTGQPLIFRAAMKPIATTLQPQQSVDLARGENVPTQYERSDFCPVPRAVPILEAVTAIVLADALLAKLGGDSLHEMLPRYEGLRKLRLSDLRMDDRPHTYWPDEP